MNGSRRPRDALRAHFVIARDWRGADVPADEHVTIALRREVAAWHIEVEAPFHGGPPPAPAGSTDRLWEHEVVEVFLVGHGERYTEIELGPHGNFLVLQLAGVRQVAASHLPLDYVARIEGGRWRGCAALSRSLAPESVLLANAYAIHGHGASRRYLAAHPVPGSLPDFHRIHLFPALGWDAETE